MARATEIDMMVGARVRIRRLELDLTQQELGRKLGITFQQIQKYESGQNRISAGRLKEMSRILKVPITYFFADADAVETTEAQPVTALKLTTVPGATELLLAYARIKSPALRKSLVIMMRSLARSQSLDSAATAPDSRPGSGANRRPGGERQNAPRATRQPDRDRLP